MCLSVQPEERFFVYFFRSLLSHFQHLSAWVFQAGNAFQKMFLILCTSFNLFLVPCARFQCHFWVASMSLVAPKNVFKNSLWILFEYSLAFALCVIREGSPLINFQTLFSQQKALDQECGHTRQSQSVVHETIKFPAAHHMHAYPTVQSIFPRETHRSINLG